MSFNIDNIIKECPNAFRKWILYTKNVKDTFEVIDYRFSVNGHFIVIIKFPDGFTLEIERHFRELYDFFDSVGVKISIYWSVNEGWLFDIFVNNSKVDIKRCYADNRSFVEFVAIPKAFEIYEKQLNIDKKRIKLLKEVKEHLEYIHLENPHKEVDIIHIPEIIREYTIELIKLLPDCMIKNAELHLYDTICLEINNNIRFEVCVDGYCFDIISLKHYQNFSYSPPLKETFQSCMIKLKENQLLDN